MKLRFAEAVRIGGDDWLGTMFDECFLEEQECVDQQIAHTVDDSVMARLVHKAARK